MSLSSTHHNCCIFAAITCKSNHPLRILNFTSSMKNIFFVSLEIDFHFSKFQIYFTKKSFYIWSCRLSTKDLTWEIKKVRNLMSFIVKLLKNRNRKLRFKVFLSIKRACFNIRNTWLLRANKYQQISRNCFIII